MLFILFLFYGYKIFFLCEEYGYIYVYIYVYVYILCLS